MIVRNYKIRGDGLIELQRGKFLTFLPGEEIYDLYKGIIDYYGKVLYPHGNAGKIKI